MSFNISPVGAAAAAQTQAAAATSSATQAEAAATVDPGEAVSVDVDLEASTIPDAPPPEVHHAITVAAQSYQKLQASGKHLSFTLDSGSGALTVQLKDLAGNHISNLTVSDALKIAAGGSA